VLLTAQRDGDLEDPEPDDLHRIGTVAMVMRSMRLPDGRVKVLVQGLSRAEIDDFVDRESGGLWAPSAPIAEPTRAASGPSRSRR
jgi:ATP-dependent Lon protease